MPGRARLVAVVTALVVFAALAGTTSWGSPSPRGAQGPGALFAGMMPIFRIKFLRSFWAVSRSFRRPA
jgi:hypothetical protein